MTKTRCLTPLVIAMCMSACATRPTIPMQTRNAVLAEYARGASLERLAQDFRLGSRDDARGVVHDAMLALQKRYYRDR
jgi:hypothetical protein